MDTTPDNARAVNVSSLADGDLLRWDAADAEFKRLAIPTAVAIPAAITGGEAPTEAEFNALRAAVAANVAALVAAGLMKPAA